MAYSAEVMRRAREALAQKKAEKESKYLQHQQDAYTRVPRLREIDRLLRQHMALAAQLVFTKGAQDALEQAKQENLALQRERDDLIAAHFEEGYLDDTPICSYCGGSGYMGSTMCSCLKELCRAEQRRELALLAGENGSFEDFSLDYYSTAVDKRYGASPRQIMQYNLQYCQKYAAQFDGKGENLLFIGGTGLGKTFMSACIAREVIDRGCSVLYETSSRLFTKLEQAKFGGDEASQNAVRGYYDCDLMIVDDLGTEMGNQFVTSALYALLNERLLAEKPTVISTNLTAEEIALRYSPQIASRLQGNFKRLIFVGEDIRVLKGK